MDCGHPGTVIPDIGHDQHICAITGRMLRIGEEILEAETLDEFPLFPEVDPKEIMIHAMTLFEAKPKNLKNHYKVSWLA